MDGGDPRADLVLDFDRLSSATVSDRGDVVLLAWLSTCNKALEKLSEEEVRPEQKQLEATLLRIIQQSSTSSAPCPKPGRPARNLVARAFVSLFAKAETRSLFEVLQSLVRVANDSKAEVINKVACVYVAGELMLAHGQQCMSMYAEIVLTCLKLFRQSSLPVIFRHAALLCLRKTLSTGGRSTSDALAKDILKALKYVLSDKAQAIQRASAEALLVFYEVAPIPLTLPEIEQVVGSCIRAMDTVDFQTRRAFSRLAAGLLASTQVEGSAPAPEPIKSRKAKDSANAEDDDDPYPTTMTAPADEKMRTLLSVTQMLHQLSIPYNKPATSRRARVGIIDIYATLFTALGTHFVEQHYSDIFRHITEDLANLPAVGPRATRFETLVTRRLCAILLRDVIGIRILSETGQILALREISTSLLKRWPALMPGQVAPNKMSLLTGLDEVVGLIQQLGSAPLAVQDILFDPLVRLTGHPSRSIQVAACVALRAFCHAVPMRLTSTLAQILEVLSKDLALLGQPRGTSGRPEDIEQRTVGHAIAIAALISLVPSRPLYVSFDISARVMSLAIQLLKQSGAHELHISGVEIEVAWTLVPALMRLGPNFVRLHLPQLLILWKNALPKPTSKDASAAQVRTETEWEFLLHIRECTLAALLAFFKFNGAKLVTADVGRRIAVMLNNGFVFAQSFENQHASLLQEQSQAAAGPLSLVDRNLMLWRRLFECYVALGAYPAALESAPMGGIMSAALAAFADPDRHTGSLVQAAIVASSGTFTSVWEAVDGYGYGVTTYVNDTGVELNRDLVEVAIDAVLKRPVQRAPEHDNLFLDNSAPPPAASGTIDAAIDLFASFFAGQTLQQQSALMQEMHSYIHSPKLDKVPGRRMAVLVNSVVAISRALQTAMTNTSARSADNIAVPQLNSIMRDIIKVRNFQKTTGRIQYFEQIAVTHSDSRMRALGSEAMGRLAHVAGTSFLASEIQSCISQIVSNTDPSGRAGLARTFGEVYRHVGTIAAGAVLKTIVEVLMSLAADPHPLVHFWALDALAVVIDSAGLSYSPYISATLGILARLYMSELHEPEGGSASSVNMRADLPAHQACCKVADALIRVLGPELQEEDMKQQLMLILVREFSREPDEGVAVEASHSIQHFVMFAPVAVDFPQLVILLRAQMSSSRRPLKIAAINGIYQLVQRDVSQMSRLGGDRLVEELFALLDNDPSIEGVRDAILSWLKQTAVDNPIAWVDLCQRIMSRTNASTQVAPTTGSASKAIGGIAFADEESQGIGLDAGTSTSQATSRWRTQLFALQCLHQVFLVLRNAGRREHFDPALSKHLPSRKGLMLARVGDLIKMAFTASTAPVMEIRLEGVTVLRDVIENFSKSRDLDFDDALLLEQFQAPIAAALTPAFSSDSYPEVLASAVQVCAIFIGSGVVREVAKMGRILRLLTIALESCKDADLSSISDLKDLSSTAAVMLKTSIFAAWAELQVASSRQAYLVDLIKPHLSLLCPFWVASLREYARFRTDPEASLSASGSSSFEATYSGLSREVALPYYEQSVVPMLAAVASLLKAMHPIMIAAMDGVDLSVENGVTNERSPAEPTLFFFVIFGLAFEALAAPAADRSGNEGMIQGVQGATAALDALGGLVSPSLAGRAILQEGLFDDLCNLCYRLLSVEPAPVQARVVGVILALSRNYKTDLLGQPASTVNGSTSETSQPDNDRMLRLVRLVCLVLQQAIPSPASRLGGTVDARVALLRVSFIGLMDLADIYPPRVRSDLYAAIFTFYAQLMRDESSPIDVMSPSLPILKMLTERSLSARQPGDELLPRVINGMLSACLQNVEDVRGRSSSSVLHKKRGNLLAAVLLITSLPGTIKMTQAAVEHACFLISQSLLEDEEMQSTAVHCAKTLILAAGRGIAALQYSVGQLLPALLAFVASLANKRGQITDANLVSLVEVFKTFVGLFAILSEPHHKAALGVFLPTFLMLIEPVSSPPTPQHALAVQHVLQMAARDPVAFKDAMTNLETEDRVRLESAIRQSVGSAGPIIASPARPTIDLKMSF